MSLQIGECFQSAFGDLTFNGIILAILFTAVWLLLYQPPMIKKPLLWAFFVSGAIITLCAFCIIQNPLLIVIGRSFYNTWGEQFVQQWILVLAIPGALISGLVLEGAKILPGVIYWWKNGRTIDPKWGLIIGAVSGAGFGFIQAQWLHNSVFALGWSWEAIGTRGFAVFAPFVETFFTIPFHIATCAFIGYGLAKGKGWQYYLILALVQAVFQYSSTFVIYTFSGLSDGAQLVILEAFVAVISLAATAVALRLLWLKLKGQPKGTSTG
jgi:hypothetical protein